MQCLANLICTKSWRNIEKLPEQFRDADRAELNRFKHVRHELTVNHETNIILRDSHIVVPAALRNKVVSIAHEGHQGLVKTKQLLREKIWFPGIDDTAQRMIKNCIACQANGPSNHPDPLQISPLLPDSCHTVHMDFCGPFPSGEYLFFPSTHTHNSLRL